MEPQEGGELRNDLIRDATVAAVLCLVDNLDMLPADKGRIASFFADVIYDAIECAIIIDRRARFTPSDN